MASHALASGMGGLRTSGDLVARMQMTRGMRLDEAKKYVADKLHISVEELSDEVVMSEVRKDFDIGTVTAPPGKARGIEAQIKIAKLLDIDINSVRRFRERTS